jgi:hypothetical protein
VDDERETFSNTLPLASNEESMEEVVADLSYNKGDDPTCDSSAAKEPEVFSPPPPSSKQTAKKFKKDNTVQELLKARREDRLHYS